MLESTKNELDKLMSSYSNDLGGMTAKKNEEKLSQENFAKEFEKLKHEIIWPIIVEVGNQLNSYGHDFHVSEEEEYVDATARYQPASITLNIYPATTDRALYQPESTPYISFVANKYAKKIGIMVSTMMPDQGGVVGSHGEYEAYQITPEFVEKEIIEVLKDSLIFHKDTDS
jgi:hypothetical protein